MVVGAAVGSLMIGIFGRLQFKVIKAAMPDDFLRIPAFSIGAVIFEKGEFVFSHFNIVVNIQCCKRYEEMN